MGFVISKVFPKEDPPAPEFIVPTARQMQILKDTWEIPKAKLSDSGEYILFRFLDDFPHNQDKFEAFRNVPLLSLKGTPGFRTHSDHIMVIFQGAIDCLSTDDPIGNLEKLFTPMGFNHARRVTDKQAFLDLRGIVMEVLTETCHLDLEQQEAWTVFYNDAIHLVFRYMDVYYEAKRQQKQQQ